MEGLGVKETFILFLQELEGLSLGDYSGKELLEREVLRVMHDEGFSDQQVYDMSLEKLLDLFYNAYFWKATKLLSSKNEAITT